jgi:outer membrane receptor for ferrienterochelin and colicins
MRYIYLLIFINSVSLLKAQEKTPVDSLPTVELQEVMVTATRNERVVGALPMPVSLISQSQIRAIGSLRLNDVLAEQTGLVVVPQVNGLGNGLQLQGFNPDYTLILIDGEPIIGRNTGSLELSRVAVGNIKQIEIVKGPSSSLYGSEALAGVVNIITDRPAPGSRFGFHTRYGTNQSLDVNMEGGVSADRVGIYLFANRYTTDGYDLSPDSYGNTVSPFSNNTFSGKSFYKFSPTTELTVAGRYFEEKQVLKFEVESNGSNVLTYGTGTSQDWNLNPVLTHRFNDRFQATARLYSTRFKTQTELNLEQDQSLYYQDFFHQTFTRPEVVGEYFIHDQHVLTFGSGHIRESVNTSRYGDSGIQRQHTTYGFFQWEWQPSSRWSVISGGRYDFNSIYGSQFSPKFSTRYEISDRLSFKISSGVGFKSPDFRQLYFNFFNSAGGGYSVLGTVVAQARLSELEAAGQIDNYLFDPSTLKELQAERSFSVNLGGQWKPTSRIDIDWNLFRNSVDNLIETQPIALTTSNQSIFSYRNIKRAFTQGVETTVNYKPFKHWQLSVGYQLLFAKDKDVLNSVRRGEIFWRDPETLGSKRLQPREYFGLYNRSRHMGNVKLFYRNPDSGWEGSLRVIYRGKYGVGDLIGNIQGEIIPPSNLPGNSVLDIHDDFIQGYALVNLSVGKSIKPGIRVQLGVDNLFDHTEPVFIPNLPGRLVYTSFSFSFQSK